MSNSTAFPCFVIRLFPDIDVVWLGPWQVVTLLSLLHGGLGFQFQNILLHFILV